jgi:hypothetical protein
VSTSTATRALGSRPLRPLRSTTVRPRESSDEQSTTTFTYSVVRSPGRTSSATATASYRASPILVVWVGRVKRGFSAAMGCSSRLSSYFCAGADARVAGRGRLGGRRREQARRRAVLAG